MRLRYNRMITIDNLNHFIAVVENNGVLRAAEKLFISPSSITRSVQSIEDQLGYQLFDRIRKRIQITQRGRDFYEEARNLLLDFQKLIGSKENPKMTLTGHYRIGASHFLCQYLAKSLSDLGQSYPHASFEVFSLDSSHLIKKIHRGEIDLGISFSPKLSESLGSERIFSGQLLLSSGKSHPLAKMSFSKLKKEINNHAAIIHRPTDSIDRCDNHPMFHKHGIRPSIQMYWDSDFFALSMMETNLYWSMLPDFVIYSNSKITRLDHPADWKAPYSVQLVWNLRKEVSTLKNLISSAYLP